MRANPCLFPALTVTPTALREPHWENNMEKPNPMQVRTARRPKAHLVIDHPGRTLHGPRRQSAGVGRYHERVFSDRSVAAGFQDSIRSFGTAGLYPCFTRTQPLRVYAVPVTPPSAALQRVTDNSTPAQTEQTSGLPRPAVERDQSHNNNVPALAAA